MAESLIQYACEDQVATITFNRPDKLNAFTDDMVREFADVLRHFDLDPDANVAILCGAGRAFSAGADVQQRQLRTREEFDRNGGPQGWGANASELLMRSVNWKPVIAAPHGYAVGLGLGLTMESDLVVAEEGTKFQVAETKRGLAASRYWALLNLRAGSTFATELVLTGRFFTAEEALAAGIINRVAKKGEHLEAARALAREIARNPPLSVRATVRSRRWYMELAEKEAYLQTTPLKLHLTEDFAESARAFTEKRKPRPYTGR
jgi:enoyl-CoA hydratase/carnithine racemase